MKVILKETIDTLGIIGTECNVADGYARNYLLPQKKAMEATPQNRKVLEHEKAKFDLQIAKEKEFASQMAKRLEKVKCTISAKVYEEIKLYGSITESDILDALSNQDVKIEKRMLLLAEPIKEIGEYMVPIRLYKDVEPEIKVVVVAE
ncbi:MAG: 50S ribosomal protein L9 [Desulfobacteraceae bacterium 4572_19]|nr:MAG: 50S ribosomal protein L9 [Desulfobacteraceae bacterium 4572_19]